MKNSVHRRKLHNLNDLGRQQKKGKEGRESSRTFSNLAPPSSHDYKKTIKDLQNLLEEETAKRKEAEQSLLIFKQRTLLRQKEFYNVLEKTNKQVKKYAQSEKAPQNEEELNVLYEKIFHSFELTNIATNKFIQDQYRDNYAMMERRVGEVISSFKAQLAKSKRLSESSYRNIKEEIENILFLAKAIHEENNKISQTLKDEKFKSQLLREEKKILLDQIVQKKKVISRLNAKAERQSRISITEDFPKKEKSQNYSTNVPSVNVTKFLCEPSIDVSQFHINKSLNLTQKRVISSRYGNSHVIAKRHSVGLDERSKKNDDKNEKTIKHLKMCLERERKKVIELGTIVTQIQNKNNEINDAIIESFDKSKSEDEKLTDLLKSEKLFQTIKDLKRRLAMSEKPTVLCGWGDMQFDEIVPK